MHRAIWKHALLVAAIAGGAHPAFGQTPSAGLAALSEDEQLFDSHLVAQQAQCTIACPPAYCPPNNCQPSPGAASPYSNLSPGQSPSGMPQMTSPNQVFAPGNVGSLSAGQGALGGENLVAASMMAGGYLDPAAPVTQFRLRYDNAQNNPFPDRGEYFYAKCGCFRQLGIDPNAQGPIGENTSVDYQDVRAYFEYAFDPKFSLFTELPVRFVDYTSTAALPALGSASGFADMNAGFKYAFIAEKDEYLTFQFKTYIPTGDSRQGLGTNHVSIEPAILYYRQLSDKWLFQSQFSEFTPIGVSSFASNVLSYGGGLGYIAYQGDSFTIIPMFETVGWTFLGGQKFNPQSGLSSASGDTIVNVKPGVRVGFGDTGPAMLQQQSIYAGFGIPVTNEKFYEQLFRVEYRILF
ncbi:MAG TPA: transporter [Caulifigura sp.]|nr:transporter [Caulifigura sp.]